MTGMPAVATPQRASHRTIDDVAGAGKIAVSRRLLAESVEPFFPPIDIIRRG
jgi:hypothetical protein